MTDHRDIDGYDRQRVAEMYDLDRRYHALKDIAFYADEAARSDGPVLELGCGTGRVTLAMAARGVEVVGVDRSEPMLEVLTKKLAEADDDAARRVQVLCGDVRALTLDRRFPLVAMPFRVMQHLVKIDDQMAALESVRRHLTPGGRFVFDVFYPDVGILARGGEPEAEDFPWTEIDGGLTIRRTSTISKVDLARQVLHSSVFYHVRDGSGKEERFEHAFEHRYFFRWELEHLLSRAGFAIESFYADFDRTPIDKPRFPKEQIVTARSDETGFG